MIEILLTRGKVAIIDDDDFELVSHPRYKWRVEGNTRTASYHAVTRDPYGSSSVLKMSKLLTGAQKGERVFHRNGNTLDLRRGNMQVCTPSEYYHNCAEIVANPSRMSIEESRNLLKYLDSIVTVSIP
jgi:hypothetical protein